MKIPSNSQIKKKKNLKEIIDEKKAENNKLHVENLDNSKPNSQISNENSFSSINSTEKIKSLNNLNSFQENFKGKLLMNNK